MNENMDLSVIIVSWKVKELLKENLEAIFANTKSIKFEVFVVDNDSRDGTMEMVTQDFPQVTFIGNNFNAGFAKANNQGMEMAQGRYVLLLNPDMRVLEGTLEKMVKWMDGNLDVGLAGCRLQNQDGELIKHARRLPKLIDQLSIVLKLPHLFPKILDKYLISDFDYDKEAEPDSIRGSFFMLRGDVIKKLGGLDERYFIWFEEVDYCRQVRNAGWKIKYTPVTTCIDRVGQSFSQVKRGKTQEYFRDSMLKYFWKWHPKWQWFVLWFAWPIGRTMALAGEKINIKTRAKT